MAEDFPGVGAMRVGDALPGRAFEMGRGAILKFNRYVTGGRDAKNIHTDDETARRAGLPRAVATGRHPVAFIAELMVEHLGAGFLAGGELEVSFVKPVFPGDVLRLSATLREKKRENGETRLLFDVALLNQDGVAVTVGAAGGHLPGSGAQAAP